MKSTRRPLIEVGHKLQRAGQRAASEEQHKEEKLDEAQPSQNLVRRIKKGSKIHRDTASHMQERHGAAANELNKF